MVTLLAKGMGLIRDSLIAATFSTGIAADAFMSASKLPTTLFDMVVGGVISASFIPVFSSVREEDGALESKKFANRFVTLIFVISCLIAVFGIIFAHPLVNLLAPDFSGEKHLLTVSLTRIMFPMIIFTGLAFSYVGILQSNGEYKIPSLISLVSNLAIIVYFITLGKTYGIEGLAVTMVIAWGLQVAVQVPSLIKLKSVPKPDFWFFDKNIKRAMLLAGPMLISTWVQPLYSIINSRLASGIDGAVSTLEYANRLYIMLTGVFSFVVTNLIFPKLAAATAKGDEVETKELMSGSIKAICAVIMPIMAMFIILAAPITSIIYEHNNFTASDAAAVSSALMCYGVGMLGLALNEVLSKIFFSRQNSKTPMVNSVISMLVNIVFAYVLFGAFGVSGLALAAALGSIFNALLNAVCLARECKNILTKSDVSEILKLIIAALVTAAVCFIVYTPFKALAGGFINSIIKAAVPGVAGVITYLAACFILKIEIVTGAVTNLIKRK